MLNSADHEIVNAHKYCNIKKFSILQAKITIMLFFLLIYVKMPKVFAILTFMSRKISCSAELSMNFFITSRPILCNETEVSLLQQFQSDLILECLRQMDLEFCIV